MRVRHKALCIAVVALFIPGGTEPVCAVPLGARDIIRSLPTGTVELVARHHEFPRDFRGGGFRGGFAGRRMGGYGRVERPGFAGGGVQRRGMAGGYARQGGAVVRGNVVVGGTYRPRGAWWPEGDAATAAAWAGSPPAPGYCKFHTDSSRTNGFWDRCPA